MPAGLPHASKRKRKYYPVWKPRYDYGHWNERWGKNLPPLPLRRTDNRQGVIV